MFVRVWWSNTGLTQAGLHKSWIQQDVWTGAKGLDAA